jgi:hypothetical protein
MLRWQRLAATIELGFHVSWNMGGVQFGQNLQLHISILFRPTKLELTLPRHHLLSRHIGPPRCKSNCVSQASFKYLIVHLNKMSASTTVSNGAPEMCEFCGRPASLFLTNCQCVECPHCNHVNIITGTLHMTLCGPKCKELYWELDGVLSVGGPSTGLPSGATKVVTRVFMEKEECNGCGLKDSPEVLFSGYRYRPL